MKSMIRMTTRNSTSWVRGCAADASRGFSLVEVLIAMGIFAVGFVAVAAMFPAGAMLQKETVSQVESQLVARNAAAIVRSTRITFRVSGHPSGINADLDEKSCAPGDMTPVSLATAVHNNLPNRWRLGDRGYPTAQQTTDDRKYYWIPFIHRFSQDVDTKDATKKAYVDAKEAADFNLFVFVLRREPGQKYIVSGNALNGTTIPGANIIWANAGDGDNVPKVVGVQLPQSSAVGATFSFNNDLFPVGTPDGLPDQVRIGDYIADNNGSVYLVSGATAGGCTIIGGIRPTPVGGTVRLWYAPPPAPGTSTPCTRIVQLSGLIDQLN